MKKTGWFGAAMSLLSQVLKNPPICDRSVAAGHVVPIASFDYSPPRNGRRESRIAHACAPPAPGGSVAIARRGGRIALVLAGADRAADAGRTHLGAGHGAVARDRG